MHDRLLEALLGCADVRLVAALTNPLFGLPGDKQIQIFIPDLHLLSAARRAGYTYGTNHEELLVRVCRALVDLKAGAAVDERVVIFHIGDYLDLWRESISPDGSADTAARIKQDHETLVDLLEGAALNTHFLLGNHDFELYRFPAYNRWERRFFIPGSAPAVMVLHGDFFDWVEREVPEELRDIAVYLFGRDRQASSAVVGKMEELARKQNAAVDYSLRIQLAEPAPLGTLRAADLAVPSEFNVQRENGAVEGGLQFLDAACEECVKSNAEFHTRLTTVIIGHTHHARIAVRSMPDGTPFTLIDTGAWIENCAETAGGPPLPNAQITAVSANQARIYQLSPRE